MPGDTGHRRLVTVTATVGVVGLLLAGVEVTGLPEPRGDGLPTAFGAAFALLFGLGSLAAVAAAGLLATAVRRDAGPWSRRLLAGGAVAAGLATLTRALGTAELLDITTVGLPWVRGWALFALVGVVCTGIGTLAFAVEPLERPLVAALGAGTLTLVGSVVAWVAGASVQRVPVYQATAVGLFCAVLGGALHLARPLDRWPVQGALAGIVCLGVTGAVFWALAGRTADATLVAFGSLAALWALAATSPGSARGQS